MNSDVRRQIFCGNWKMHRTIAESLELATAIKNAVGPSVHKSGIEVVLAPVFTALSAVGARLSGSQVSLAAQDCYWEKQGAFTGEVSAYLLKDLGCRYVIVGHSERRHYFGETDEGVNKKAKAVLGEGMRPIVCIGETAQERDDGQTWARLKTQLSGGLLGFSAEQLRETVVAYEPVWAIGTGRVATPAQAGEAHAFIRQHLRQHFGGVAESVRIQYGGSVKADNVAGLLAQPDIDGALVGGASLSAEEFLKIVRYQEVAAS
jgi:triosephosphate isomerase